MMPQVVLLYSARLISDDVLDFIRGSVPEGFRWRTIEQGAPASVRQPAIADADYVFAYPGDPSAAELTAARHIKLFQLLSAGYDWLDLDLFRRLGITVASNDGSNAVSTAEHAMALMLSLLKQLPGHHASVVAGQWPGMRHAMQMRELHGKVVGLVGFGHIARQVALRVHAFGAQVYYTKPRRMDEDIERQYKVSYLPLDQLLAQSDIISLHAPLRPETKRMIDAPALRRMRRGSWLINTARGALVDQAALTEALIAGHLAGAALDVFEQEPLDAASPLLRLPNVVLTPHIGGASREAWIRRMSAAWDNVLRVEASLEPNSRIA